MAAAIGTASPALAAESLRGDNSATIADLTGKTHLQQPTVTRQQLPDGTIVTTTTTGGPGYDPSIYGADSRVVHRGIPMPDPNAPIVTQDGRYDGRWSGGYTTPDGRVYQGRWAGTYQDAQGQRLQGEYRGTYIGDSRYTDANGNPVGVDFPAGAQPQALPGQGYPGPGYPAQGWQGGYPATAPGVAIDRTSADLLERCRRDNGVGGALIGGALGAVAGNRIAGRGNRTAGTLIGAGAGAIAGTLIDRAENDPCRDLERQQAAAAQTQPRGYGYGYGYPYYPYYPYYPQYYYPQQTVTVVVHPGGCGSCGHKVIEEEVYYTTTTTKRRPTKTKRLRR
ncbi:MAG: glycine zipper 2TM domain-containing protein [Pseudomonadota bacterium]